MPPARGVEKSSHWIQSFVLSPPLTVQERELARLQTEGTAVRQIEANLAQDRLKRTLTTCEVIALTARGLIEGLTRGLDDSLHRMADDLNGGERP